MNDPQPDQVNAALPNENSVDAGTESASTTPDPRPDVGSSTGGAKTRRSAAVALGGAALLSTALAGCATEADYAQVCVDQRTQQRVAETNCEPGSPFYGSTAAWFYIPRGAALPGIGSSISSSSGSYSAPATGSVTRGGFGSSRGGFSFGG